MIYCVNWLDKGNSDEGRKLIYVELYTETAPSSFDIVPSGDIKGLPNIRDYDEMEFAPGSILLVTTGPRVFTYIDDTFKDIGTGD